MTSLLLKDELRRSLVLCRFLSYLNSEIYCLFLSLYDVEPFACITLTFTE